MTTRSASDYERAANAARAKPGSAEFRRILFEHLKSAKASLLIATLCMAGTIAAELAAPWPIKFIFDYVLLGKALPPQAQSLMPGWLAGGVALLPWLAASIFVLVLINGAFSYLQNFITTRIGYELTYTLRRELFARLQRASLAHKGGRNAGDLLVKFANDTAIVKDLVADWLLTLMSHGVLISFMLGIMFIINWRLASVVAATVPLLGWVLFRLNRRIRRSLDTQRKQEGRMAAKVGEMLSSIRVVQAFGRETHEVKRFDATSSQNLSDGIRTARETAAVAKAIALISAAATTLTVLVGADQVLNGFMSPGDLLVFMAYLRSLFKPLRNLGKLSVKISRAAVSARRIGEILALETVPPDRPGALAATGIRGRIDFENVGFSYSDSTTVLSDVSFSVKAGERVAIVGASGSGKSTIASLLTRLFEPQSGQIRIDGIDLRDYQRESLRDSIGIVLQDTWLFGATIRENITYGRPDASDLEVEAAARAAEAHDFIALLPDGYSTVIGDQGVTLSGGQRQRICLARAIVKKPAILILDEPTTAIDVESAQLIDAAVRRIQAGKTTLVISHQFRSMTGFDRVLVLANGRIEAARYAHSDEPRDPELRLVQ